MVLLSYVVTFMPILPSGANMAKVYLPIEAAPFLEHDDWMACLKLHDARSKTQGSMRTLLGGVLRANTYVDRDTAQWTLDFRSN